MDENLIKENRRNIYKFYDTELLNLFERTTDIKEIHKYCKTKKPQYKWRVKQYDATIRISAWIDGLNYLYFMVWTPKDKQEYQGWGDVKYHGSRGN